MQIILFYLYDDVQLTLYVRFLCSYAHENHELYCVYAYLVGKFFSLYDTSLRIAVTDSLTNYIE